MYASPPNVHIRPPRSFFSLLCGLLLFLFFAGLYFNPLTRANIIFAVGIDPDMRALANTDTSLMALLYFASVGLCLGLARLAIFRHFQGLRAILVTWPTMLIGTTAGSYLGLRLLNPALPCMLEICHSPFLLNYGVPTLGLGVLLASFYSNRDPSFNGSPSWSGCIQGVLTLLLLAGLFLFLLWIGLTHPSGTC